jgi:hypothetical protein
MNKLKYRLLIQLCLELIQLRQKHHINRTKLSVHCACDEILHGCEKVEVAGLKSLIQNTDCFVIELWNQKQQEHCRILIPFIQRFFFIPQMSKNVFTS